MGDLEEKFLKKNIPGKYSTWGEDYNEKSRNDDNGDNDAFKGEIETEISGRYGGTSTATTRYNNDKIEQTENTARCNNRINTGIGITKNNKNNNNSSSSSSNTGVKGVLSDYRQAKAFEKLQISNEEINRQEAFRTATEAAWMKPGEQSISIAAEEQRRKNAAAAQRNHDGSDSDSDSDSFFDDDDDEFLQSYRQQRMTEMKQEKSQSTLNTTTTTTRSTANDNAPISTSKPRNVYGNVTELENLIQFSNVIDETDKSTYCIFHLYEPTISRCRLMNEHLDHLAECIMPQCRFFRLRSSLVKDHFDPVGFPCILVYRDGKEVANLTPITEHFDIHFDSTSTTSCRSSSIERFTSEDVQYALRRNGVRDA